MSKFQLILLGVFGVFIVIGLISFAMYKGSGVQKLSPITIWGVIKQQQFNTFLSEAQQEQKESPLSVTYVEKNPATFETELVEALASGRGPDAILLPHTFVVKQAERIVPIPYTSLPLRNFRDTYIEQAELYLTQDGILGIPFIVDPLVLYWNRDIFSSNFVVEPPRYWSDVSALASKLTKKDARQNILQSAIALGTYENITHAKEILSALLLQSSVYITQLSERKILSKIASDTTRKNAESAIAYYMSFADTSSPTYSWNRSLRTDKDAFIAGDLAMYIGSASEIADIRAKNPNLNFDIAQLPQLQNASGKVSKTATYGTMYGLSVLRMSRAVNDAFSSLILLSDPANIPALVSVTNLPPVRKDLLSQPQSDPYASVLYRSAIVSRGWLDPDPVTTNKLFGSLVQNISTGKLSLDMALSKIGQEIQSLAQ